jgi:N-acetylmuramoyl-L-alanine amidase
MPTFNQSVALKDAAKFGLKVEYSPNYKQRWALNPIGPGGIIEHHTAGSRNGNLPSRNILENGRPGIPGPLANAGLGRDGTILVLTDRKANHGGLGMASVALAAARGLAYGLGNAKSVGLIVVNTRYVGLEIENVGTGVEAYPDAQYKALVTWSALICIHMNWDAGHVIGHRESTSRKIDPVYAGPLKSMQHLRTDVDERIRQIKAGEVSAPPETGEVFWPRVVGLGMTGADVDLVYRRYNPDAMLGNRYSQSLADRVKTDQIAAGAPDDSPSLGLVGAWTAEHVLGLKKENL